VEPFHLFQYIDEQAFRVAHPQHPIGIQPENQFPYRNIGSPAELSVKLSLEVLRTRCSRATGHRWPTRLR
jgi:hypothetical protein